MHRSIASPSLWRIAYALIIASEGATALGFAGGAALLLRHLRSQAACFNRANGLTAVAAGLGFLVWFFGFMVIGGEWFQIGNRHNGTARRRPFAFI